MICAGDQSTQVLDSLVLPCEKQEESKQTKATTVAASYRAVPVPSLALYFLSIMEYTFSLVSEMEKQNHGLHNVTTRRASQLISHFMVGYLLLEHELKQV